MKMRRFFSLFFTIVLVFTLIPPPSGRAAEEDPITDAVEVALLVDRETEMAVYEKNAEKRSYPASLTKVMTALLTLEALDAGQLTMEQEITATEAAFDKEHGYFSSDSSTANIKVGEVMSVRNLLECMLIVSANEAANILAIAVAGDIPAFVTAMNRRAAALGCKDTHFVNTNGLHSEEHYTTAWDLYRITREAMTHPVFMEICDTANVIIPATNLSGERNYWTTNHLLSNWRVIGYRNKEAHGIKTGSTSAAGYCLISSARRGELEYISVIMNAQRTEEGGVGEIHSFSETTALFNYGFANFGYRKIIRTKDVIAELPVTLSKSDYVAARPSRDVEVLFPKALSPDDLERQVDLEVESLEAPVAAGQKVGMLTLSHEGKVYAEVELLTSNAVEADPVMVFWRDTREFFSRTYVRIALAAAAALIILALLWKLIFGRRRYRYGRSVGGGSRNYRGRR